MEPALLNVIANLGGSGLIGICFYILLNNVLAQMRLQQDELSRHREKEETILASLNATLTRIEDKLK